MQAMCPNGTISSKKEKICKANYETTGEKARLAQRGREVLTIG